MMELAPYEIQYVRRKVLSRGLIDGRARTSLPEYPIWTGMIARCHNQNHASYSRYGGRGIVVCDRWREDFANFYQDMGSRPSRKHASHNTSGFKGVSFYRQTGRWQAYIRHGGRRLHLGMFATAEDAAAAYDAAAIRLKGEFARTNAMIQAEAA